MASLLLRLALLVLSLQNVKFFTKVVQSHLVKGGRGILYRAYTKAPTTARTWDPCPFVRLVGDTVIPI